MSEKLLSCPLCNGEAEPNTQWDGEKLVPAPQRKDLPGIEYTEPGCLSCRFCTSYKHWQALPRVSDEVQTAVREMKKLVGSEDAMQEVMKAGTPELYAVMCDVRRWAAHLEAIATPEPVREVWVLEPEYMGEFQSGKLFCSKEAAMAAGRSGDILSKQFVHGVPEKEIPHNPECEVCHNNVVTQHVCKDCLVAPEPVSEVWVMQNGETDWWKRPDLKEAPQLYAHPSHAPSILRAGDAFVCVPIVGTPEKAECDRCLKPIMGERHTWCNDCYRDYIPSQIKELQEERDAASEQAKQYNTDRQRERVAELEGEREYVYLIRYPDSHWVPCVAATKEDAKVLARPGEGIERWPVERRVSSPPAEKVDPEDCKKCGSLLRPNRTCLACGHDQRDNPPADKGEPCPDCGMLVTSADHYDDKGRCTVPPTREIPPECPKCGKHEHFYSTTRKEDMYACDCKPNYWRTANEWLRHCAESTPCKECGETPNHSKTEKTVCCCTCCEAARGECDGNCKEYEFTYAAWLKENKAKDKPDALYSALEGPPVGDFLRQHEAKSDERRSARSCKQVETVALGQAKGDSSTTDSVGSGKTEQLKPDLMLTMANPVECVGCKQKTLLFKEDDLKQPWCPRCQKEKPPQHTEWTPSEALRAAGVCREEWLQYMPDETWARALDYVLEHTHGVIEALEQREWERKKQANE